MSWGLLAVIILYAIFGFSAWFFTMATTIGWWENKNKFNWGGWFDEYKSFLIPIWTVVLLVVIFAPKLLL